MREEFIFNTKKCKAIKFLPKYKKKWVKHICMSSHSSLVHAVILMIVLFSVVYVYLRIEKLSSTIYCI